MGSKSGKGSKRLNNTRLAHKSASTIDHSSVAEKQYMPEALQLFLF